MTGTGAKPKTENRSEVGSGEKAACDRTAISIADIRAAQEKIGDRVLRTPLVASSLYPELFLKLENQQLTGSFKIRGALNKMLSLSDVERQKGIVASSAGNHAQGVAYGAKLIGAKAHIVMPETAPIVKVSATRSHGADVILHGEVYDDAYTKAQQLESEMGWTFVHPYLDPKVIAGQGTIGLELLEDEPELGTVIVPVGGGGLIGGIATAVKALRPGIKVIGVVSDQAPAMAKLFYGAPIDLERDGKSKRVATIAEGIAIKNASPAMFETYIRPLVDEIVEVSDDEIALALVQLLEKTKTVVEGSGAAGLAALLVGKIKPRGKTAVILCGGNIDLNVMSKVIERGLRSQYRLARIVLVVDDLPGNLHRITAVMTEARANILEVHHDRVSPELGLRETRIDLLVETASQTQIEDLHSRLRGQGFRVLSL